MQCYIESILQIGVINNLIGDGLKAVKYLQEGKAISCSFQLPLFIVAFSSLLGKVHIAGRQWDLAEKELRCAEKILNDNNTQFCCMKCKLILESTLHGYFGDLCHSKVSSCEELGYEESGNWYTSALDKLTLSEWKNPLSCPEDDGDGTSRIEKHTDGKRCSCTIINEEEENVSISNQNSRKLSDNDDMEGNQISGSSDMLCQEGTNSSISSKCEIASSLSKMKCWKHLASEILESRVLSGFITLKWEYARRKLSMKLLAQSVKSFSQPEQRITAQKVLLRAMSLLFVRNAFRQTFSSIPLDSFINLVAKEIPGDIFAIERAEMIYNICWHSLKCYHSKFTRNIFCNLSPIKFDDIASCLMVAFTLSREQPLVFQKVSILLTVIYIISSSSEEFLMPRSTKFLAENYWSSFYHQASTGAQITYQFLAHLTERWKATNVTGSSCIKEVTFDPRRIAPDSTNDLRDHVQKFFGNLPPTTIINLSLLDYEYINLLQELLPYPVHAKAWMVVSRMNLKTEPVVMLLPLNSIVEDECDMSTGSDISESFKKPSEVWHSQQGFSSVDEIVPAFTSILRERTLSPHSSRDDSERELWWKHARNLDDRLEKFVRKVENLWFGNSKCILAGESYCEELNSILKFVVNRLNSNYKLGVNEGLLKIVLGGTEGKSLLSQSCPKEDCYIAKSGYCKGASSGILSTAANKLISTDDGLHFLNGVLNAMEGSKSKNGEPASEYKEPVILVLGSKLQGIPWEHLPVLRMQEVYRMPSVGILSTILERKGTFPSIDPLNASYLINPSSDISSSCVKKFENYLKRNKLKGTSESKPTLQNLVSALTKHDLYLYFGHGSGSQYIPTNKMEKLEGCSAAILMGCSSGVVTTKGSYVPESVPLSYIMADAPFVVATLWPVISTEMEQFGKALYDTMNLKGCKGKSKREVSKKNHSNIHRIGTCMVPARNACSLPFLTGASVICFGVPTNIRNTGI